MGNEARHFYAFGPFRLDSRERVLLRDGQVLPLTPKVAETLLVLVENAGNLVGKDDLIRRVWPDAFVEEGNLNKNVYTLRKLLGVSADGGEYIETAPKRGYRFVAQVERLYEGPGAPGAPAQPKLTPTDEVHSLEMEVPPVGPLPGDQRSTSSSDRVSQSELPGSSAVRAAVLQMPSRTGAQLSSEVVGSRPIAVPPASARRIPKKVVWLASSLAFVALVGIGTYLYFHSRSAPKLTDQDTIVLADFTNTTGDSVFDGTLRQALAAHLQQSPFLELISDARIAQVIARMGQPKDVRLTRELAREVCQRTASAAIIEGSIASLGNRYLLDIEAVNCHNGDLLAHEQVTTNSKEQVLKALGDASTKMRRKLGESLASVEKYDVPLETVTTPSLAALQAFTLGLRAQKVDSDWAAAIPLFQRAVSLDPNFAMAWAALATSYQNLGEKARGAESMRRAYDLRERASEEERFEIESSYEIYFTGDLEAARKVIESNVQEYPRAWITFVDLNSTYNSLGQHAKSLAAAQSALKLHAGSGTLYANLAISYLNLNRLDEAKATAQDAQAHNLDSPFMHLGLYLIDFLEHDTAGMEREASGLADKPGYGDAMLYQESDTAAYAGRFAKARDLSRRAAEIANHADQKETAAEYDAEAAVRQALAGNPALARRQAQDALALSDGREVEPMSAIALGLAGDSAQARRLASDLDRRFPKDTVAQAEYLPMIHAAAILGRHSGSEDADKAIKALEGAYELGIPPMRVNFCPYPVYLRGQAYLAAGQGAAAAAEFQKVLDHPGLVVNQPIGALAHLGLGRAYVLEAGVPVAAVYDRRNQNRAQNRAHRAPPQPEALAKARVAYQDFLALWKDADPDLPILKQAKAEYARLK